MRWINKHKIPAVIILAVVVAAVSALIFFKGPDGSGFFNRIYVAVEKPMTSLGSGIADIFSGRDGKENLKAENKKLKEENQRLKKENRELALAENELRDLRELSEALNFVTEEAGEKIVTADIVDMDERGCLKTFVIDRGSSSGIKKDATVLSGHGLAGRVVSVGKNTAKIVSIIDESSRISFKVDRDVDTLGLLTETKNGKLKGYLLDNTARISEGDSVVTSGMGKYPAGIKIGKIVKTGYDSNKQLIKLTVKPSTDFGYMRKVSVIV